MEEWDTIWNMFAAKKLEESEEEVEEIKIFQNEIVIAKNQQEGRFNPSGKVYMRQQRSDTVLVPRSTVHTHCNPWRILGVNSIYFREDEIFKFEIPLMKQIRETTKERTRDWSEEYKFKKAILLNYTERGKQSTTTTTTTTTTTHINTLLTYTTIFNYLLFITLL